MYASVYCGASIFYFLMALFLSQQPAGERVLPHEHVTLNSVRHVDRTTELKTPSTGMRAQVPHIGRCSGCCHELLNVELVYNLVIKFLFLLLLVVLFFRWFDF